MAVLPSTSNTHSPVCISLTSTRPEGRKEIRPRLRDNFRMRLMAGVVVSCLPSGFRPGAGARPSSHHGSRRCGGGLPARWRCGRIDKASTLLPNNVSTWMSDRSLTSINFHPAAMGLITHGIACRPREPAAVVVAGLRIHGEDPSSWGAFTSLRSTTGEAILIVAISDAFCGHRRHGHSPRSVPTGHIGLQVQQQRGLCRVLQVATLNWLRIHRSCTSVPAGYR